MPAGRWASTRVRLIYLKTAQEARPNDPAVLRLLAEAYADLGQFDQAIACWNLVLKAKPNDEEATKAIARLDGRAAPSTAVATRIQPVPGRNGYPAAAPGAASGTPGLTAAPAAEPTASPERVLLAEIRRDPSNVPKYIELSEYYITQTQFDRAREVLQRALQVSQNDPDIVERLIDVDLRTLRHQIQQLQASGAADAAGKIAHLEKQILDKEIELFRGRVERFPGNAAFHFELALRYKLAGRWPEAIAEFQKARNDPRHRGCLPAGARPVFSGHQTAQVGHAALHGSPEGDLGSGCGIPKVGPLFGRQTSPGIGRLGCRRGTPDGLGSHRLCLSGRLRPAARNHPPPRDRGIGTAARG